MAVQNELDEEGIGKPRKAATKDAVDVINEYRQMLRRLRTGAIGWIWQTERRWNVDRDRTVVAFCDVTIGYLYR
jgi:hypothetical protein